MAIGDIAGRSHPVKITRNCGLDTRTNVGGLRNNPRLGYIPTGNRLRQIIGRRSPQRLIDIRQVLAIKLVEIAVICGMVLRAVPPVPIAALGNQELFVR